MLKNIHFSIVRGIVSKRDSGTINVNDQMQYGNRKRETEAEKLRKKRRRVERSFATRYQYDPHGRKIGFETLYFPKWMMNAVVFK